MTFFDELRRRQVVRVGVTYGAVSFAVLQSAELLITALQLPSWLLTTLTVVALVGFPVALVLAWVFELTPEGIRRTDAAPPVEPLTSWFSVRTLVILVAAVAVSGTAAWYAGRLSARASAEANIRSVAVLPFANLGHDAANQHFSDGLAEELLSALAEVDGLKVAARTSAFAFRDQNRDIREVARALGVESLVEGSVQRQNDRVRVRAKLVQASDGFQLWAHTYDGLLVDVFALQDSLAEAIAAALRVELGLAGRSRRERGLTDNLQAYDLYLLGRHHYAQRNLSDAVRYYHAAIEKDSTFGLAYSGLADAHLIWPFYDFTRTFRGETDKARPLIARALELSPDRGEVQATAGLLAFYGDRDHERALRHLGRAAGLTPSYPWTFHYRRQVLGSLGRNDAALADGRRAVELDALSPVMFGGGLGLQLVAVGKYQEAVGGFAKAVQDWNAPPIVWSTYAVALVHLGRLKEAESIYTRWAQSLEYSKPERAAVLAYAFENEKTTAEIRSVLDDIVATTSTKLSDLVLEYRLAGREPAIRAATAAVDDGSIWALFLNFPDGRPQVHALQSDSRYVALMKRAGTIPLLKPPSLPNQ